MLYLYINSKLTIKKEIVMKHVYKVNRYIDERDAIKLKSHEIDQRPKTAIESVLLFTALLIIYLIVQLIGNGFRRFQSLPLA